MTIESSYTVLNTNYVNVNIRKLCDFCVFKVDYLLVSRIMERLLQGFALHFVGKHSKVQGRTHTI